MYLPFDCLFFLPILFLLLSLSKHNRGDFFLGFGEKVDVHVEERRHLHGDEDARHEEVDHVGRVDGVEGRAQDHVLGGDRWPDRFEGLRGPFSPERVMGLALLLGSILCILSIF